MIGSCVRIGRSSMRQKAITGAPVRSEPKTGKAWACRPSSKAATDEQLGGGDDALPAAAVEAHLEHAPTLAPRTAARHPRRPRSCPRSFPHPRALRRPRDGSAS